LPEKLPLNLLSLTLSLALGKSKMRLRSYSGVIDEGGVVDGQSLPNLTAPPSSALNPLLGSACDRRRSPPHQSRICDEAPGVAAHGSLSTLGR
jgi:hypothetical protein